MARLGNDNRSNGTARLVQDTVRGSALSAAEQECDDHYGTGLLARWAVRTAPGHTGTWLPAPGRCARIAERSAPIGETV